MSEEFDREAERERLRRQLEEEEESRKATQQMSELLLKGATMTNKHCDECGDPIFRYQGQEFCPTCERTVGSQGSGHQQTEADDPAQHGQQADEADSAPQAARDTADPQPDRPAVEASTQPEPQPQQQPSAGGDLAEARASLVRKLSTLASQAEATDDVGRSRELLAAAREAAEAISALEQARR